MKIINKAARDDMVSVGMLPAQADAVVTHIPDWSQFATKKDLSDLRHDLEKDLNDLRHDLEKDLNDLRHALTWRMVTVMAVPLVMLALPLVLLILERFLP